MAIRTSALLLTCALTAVVSACSDTSSPTAAAPATARFSGSGIDTTPLGGGQVSGGGGGGTTASGACGVLSANINAYNIVVYTTRIGIGFSGSATNCGARKEAFQVDIVDQETNPACVVNVPHFIAAKNTDPLGVTFWNAGSTLVNCMNTTHTFDVILRDTKTNSVLATSTVSAFL